MRRFLISALVFVLVFGTFNYAVADDDDEDRPTIRIRFKGSTAEWYTNANSLFQNVRGEEVYIPEISVEEFLNDFCSRYGWARAEKYGYYDRVVIFVPVEFYKSFVSEFLNKEYILYLENYGEMGASEKGSMGFDVILEDRKSSFAFTFSFMIGNKSRFSTAYGQRLFYLKEYDTIHARDAVLFDFEMSKENTGYYIFSVKNYTVTPYLVSFVFQKGFAWDSKARVATYFGVGYEYLWLDLNWRGQEDVGMAENYFDAYNSADIETRSIEGSSTDSNHRLFFVATQRVELFGGLNLEAEYQATFMNNNVEFEINDYEGGPQRKAEGLSLMKNKWFIGLSFRF